MPTQTKRKEKAELKRKWTDGRKTVVKYTLQVTPVWPHLPGGSRNVHFLSTYLPTRAVLDWKEKGEAAQMAWQSMSTGVDEITSGKSEPAAVAKMSAPAVKDGVSRRWGLSRGCGGISRRERSEHLLEGEK